MSKLSNYQQWKDWLIGRQAIHLDWLGAYGEYQPMCMDCNKSITAIKITKYGQPMHRYAIFIAYDLPTCWICERCLPNLTQHLEQKRINRHYIYLVFAKIHPDVAQYAAQHWTYLIPDIKYY